MNPSTLCLALCAVLLGSAALSNGQLTSQSASEGACVDPGAEKSLISYLFVSIKTNWFTMSLIT